jgi:hypothetical protein
MSAVNQPCRGTILSLGPEAPREAVHPIVFIVRYAGDSGVEFPTPPVTRWRHSNMLPVKRQAEHIKNQVYT